MDKEMCAVILAAGNGTRLDCQDTPKAMAEVGGKPLIGHSLHALYTSRFTEDSISVVAGHQKEAIKDYCFGSARIYEQLTQDGNLSAIEAVTDNLPEKFTDILIIHADDGHNLKPETVSLLLDTHEKQGFASTLLLSHDFRSSAHRKKYIMGENNRIVDIQPIEACDGQINVFTGVYCFDRKFFESHSKLVVAPEGKERLITPIINIALKENCLGAVIVEYPWLGINTQTELAKARQFAGSGLG